MVICTNVVSTIKCCLYSAKARKDESTKQYPCVFPSRFRAFVLLRYLIVDTTLNMTNANQKTILPIPNGIAYL